MENIDTKEHCFCGSFQSSRRLYGSTLAHPIVEYITWACDKCEDGKKEQLNNVRWEKTGDSRVTCRVCELKFDEYGYDFDPVNKYCEGCYNDGVMHCNACHALFNKFNEKIANGTTTNCDKCAD